MGIYSNGGKEMVIMILKKEQFFNRSFTVITLCVYICNYLGIRYCIYINDGKISIESYIVGLANGYDFDRSNTRLWKSPNGFKGSSMTQET